MARYSKIVAAIEQQILDGTQSSITFHGKIAGEVHGRYEKIQFDWKIENFFSLLESKDNCYRSPVFECWGKCVFLQMYPKGENRCSGENRCKEWIGLYLVLRDLNPAIEIRFRLGIKTVDGKIVNNYCGTGTFGRKGKKRWGTREFLEKSEIFDQRDEWTLQDTLTITATLETGVQQPAECTTDVSLQTDVEGSRSQDVNDKNQGPDARETLTKRFEKVLWDIIKVCHSGEYSDVIIQVKEVEFKAHKVILAARTPVLSAMFQHDTAESRSGVVTIKDCEPCIFEKFLNYIYTGDSGELTAQSATALYIVADKYLTDNDLKVQCLRCIRDSLSIETFCDTVMLALRYGESELLEHANDFAAKNIRQIIKSVEWQQFNEEHPKIANEILIKALGS